THIVLSPGPGRPQDAGICEEVVRQLGGEIPILGVCLGHQAICEALGGIVGYAKEMMHGKVSMVTAEKESRLLEGFTEPFQVARYHSLAAERENLPDTLLVTAVTEDQEVMAVEHREKPIFGVQFHPESIMTPEGARMIENFLSV
nr:aminodeoxychorismate/anthranilate synthase component II [Lachnospiraceae bacterium]